MNLITDRWIPVQRLDGSQSEIAPWELQVETNPAIEIVAPRPDFRGALYQFLIGLVQTAFSPEDLDEWTEYWNSPPTEEVIRTEFQRYAQAFELLNDHGPAFMQDTDSLSEEKHATVDSLLSTTPGDNSEKLNRDFFIKRQRGSGFCPACCATALFTSQVNGIAGGQGYRTGIRGGGPLTTLVRPEDPLTPLWNTIWLNILPASMFTDTTATPTLDLSVFPWMGPTRVSRGDVKTHPDQVSPLQMFWPLPQRTRLSSELSQGKCAVCGRESQELVTHRRMTNYGTSYGSTWKHVLSPYRIQQEKDGSTIVISIKGKLGGFSYPDWLSLMFGDDQTEFAAPVVRHFSAAKVFQISTPLQARIWCFGYDANNATIRQWHDQTMPIVVIPQQKKPRFFEDARKAIDAAREAEWKLRAQIKVAWFERPEDAKGDLSAIAASFWDETGADFFSLTSNLRERIIHDEHTNQLLSQWRDLVIETAERLFDRFALQETDQTKNMRRIARAALGLSIGLRGKKAKALNVLKEAV